MLNHSFGYAQKKNFPEEGGQRKGIWIDSLSSMGMSARSRYVLESYCPYHGSCLLDLRSFRMSDCCCWATCVVVAFAFFFFSLLFGNISSGQRFHSGAAATLASSSTTISSFSSSVSAAVGAASTFTAANSFQNRGSLSVCIILFNFFFFGWV